MATVVSALLGRLESKLNRRMRIGSPSSFGVLAPYPMNAAVPSGAMLSVGPMKLIGRRTGCASIGPAAS